MNPNEFVEALSEIARTKDISKDVLIEAIEAALISGYKRNFGSCQNVRVSINRDTGNIAVYAQKEVVKIVDDNFMQVSLEKARLRNKDYEVGDIYEEEVTPKNFGRIAAQTAKQVVVQRIKEAQRSNIFEEYSNKANDIVTGDILKKDKGNVIINLGKTEAILATTEQVSNDEYYAGKRIKVFVLEVKKTTKGPQIFVSRTHPGLVKRLFEMEVPEILDGTVLIKSIAREPGSRTKIAVHSQVDNVDPLGSCVGTKGIRVQNIVDALNGEKIDIIKWSNNPVDFIISSLSPAKVLNVDLDIEAKAARVVVDDFQLSLAIGKEGQNARLAAKLTGWKIDIKNLSQSKESKNSLGDT